LADDVDRGPHHLRGYGSRDTARVRGGSRGGRFRDAEAEHTALLVASSAAI